MSTDYLNKNGLSYFWSKLKAYFAPKAHTHNAYEVKHSYTTAANQAKAWLRIANANTHQMDTSKPLHVQFLLSAWNPDQPADYYEQWFIDCQVFGRNSGIRIFGASGAPFSQARVLYENTVADIDTNDRPAIDIYLNYALATACHVEIQEVYNSGWTFLADGVLAASTIPTGFESRAVGSQGSGVHQATYASYGNYTTLQRSNITANITLADNDTYRMRVLNCTNAITVTVPSLNSAYAWFLIKNFNAVSTNKNVTIHPSTTSVLIDDSNANIVLKPGEWVIIASKAANSYSLIGDSRWKSQKADKATTLAGYGITDAKIANGTITLGSNSITPLTSVPSHNQASNTINAMTGYSKPNSTSAITTGDTLNQAIGKLEKAIDDADISNVVHLTGDEIVQGVKTFSNAHNWYTDGAATLSSIQIQSPVIERTVIPETSSFSGLIILDKNANGIDSDYSSRLAALEFSKYDGGGGGRSFIRLKTYDPTTLDNSYACIDVGYDENNVYYSTAPSTSSTRTNGNDIVTRNWIPIDTRIVHTSGDETVGGQKKFTSNIQISRNSPKFQWFAQELTKGTNPSSDIWFEILFCDKAEDTSGAHKLGQIASHVDTSGNTYTGLYSYNWVSGSNSEDSIGIVYPKNGTAYTWAPTPATSDNSTKMATTAFVKAQGYLTSHQSLDSCVKTSGDQTIGGTKTFTVSPKIQRDNPYIYFIEADQTRWTSANTSYQGLYLCDKNATEMAALICLNYSNECGLRLYSYAKGTSFGSAYLELVGAGSGSTVKSFSPYPTKSCSLGNSNHLYTQLYANTTTISTSDEKEKSNIKSIPDEVLDAWEEVSFCSFQFNDALAQKGAAARIHSGLVSQRVHEIFGRHGLDGFRYAFLCRDQGEAVDRDEKKPDGTVHHFHEDAHDSWGIRYEEALCMEAACQRRRADRAEARIAALEDRLAALELRLGSE